MPTVVIMTCAQDQFSRRLRTPTTGAPAISDALWAEVDVFGMVFQRQRRCQQANHMHLCEAVTGGKDLDCCGVSLCLKNFGRQLADDVLQTVRLELARDVIGNPARILDVFQAMRHLPPMNSSGHQHPADWRRCTIVACLTARAAHGYDERPSPQ